MEAESECASRLQVNQFEVALPKRIAALLASPCRTTAEAMTLASYLVYHQRCEELRTVLQCHPDLLLHDNWALSRFAVRNDAAAALMVLHDTIHATPSHVHNDLLCEAIAYGAAYCFGHFCNCGAPPQLYDAINRAITAVQRGHEKCASTIALAFMIYCPPMDELHAHGIPERLVAAGIGGIIQILES